MEDAAPTTAPLTIKTTPTVTATSPTAASSSSTGLPGYQPVRIDREVDDNIGVE